MSEFERPLSKAVKYPRLSGHSYGVDEIRAFNHDVKFEKKMVRFGDKFLNGTIYVGDIHSAHFDNIKKLGITHVLHCCYFPDDYPKEEGIKELYIHKLEDSSNNKMKLLSILPKCHRFLDEAFESNSNAKVLIHCLAGVSRSGSVCISYIMRKNQMSLENVLNSVTEDRNIQPNPGFTRILEWFEEKKFKFVPMGKVCQCCGMWLSDGNKNMVKCEGCHFMCYCGKRCKDSHWITHEGECFKQSME